MSWLPITFFSLAGVGLLACVALIFASPAKNGQLDLSVHSRLLRGMWIAIALFVALGGLSNYWVTSYPRGGIAFETVRVRGFASEHEAIAFAAMSDAAFPESARPIRRGELTQKAAPFVGSVGEVFVNGSIEVQESEPTTFDVVFIFNWMVPDGPRDQFEDERRRLLNALISLATNDEGIAVTLSAAADSPSFDKPD